MSDEALIDPAEAAETAPARKFYPPRVPTLCRLACQGFEMFFSDRADDPRMPGLIPRAIVTPWWNGVTALCGAEMEKYERRLRTIIGTGEFSDADQLAVELQRAAVGWTNRLLEELDRAQGDQGLKREFENPLSIADAREIARILPLSAALKSQLAIAHALLDEADQMEGPRILDLSPDTVAMLKGQYLLFAETRGPEACYLALALMNRMARPWQILLLARSVLRRDMRAGGALPGAGADEPHGAAVADLDARPTLGWRPNDPNATYAEFDAVALRLVLELQRLAHAMIELAKSANLAGEMARLRALAAQYLDIASGVAGSLSLRADSPWAEEIADAHKRLAAAFDRPFLDRVAAIVFDAEDRAGQAPAESSTEGAQFLALLLEHGGRFGLAAAARETAAELARRIGEESQRLIEAMRGASNYSLFNAQLQALLTVTEIIFKDGPGAQLARSLRLARQSSAA